MTFKFEANGKKLNYKNTILIEGLPGIGNVGKIAADFIIEKLKAKKIYDVKSNKYPHAVFVNEDNLVELPKIEIYHKNLDGRDIWILAGDVQPIDESSCYDFCEGLIDLFKKNNGKEIITLGGIGLQVIPDKPKVYATANDKKIITKYKMPGLHEEIYGLVGPVIGVTGLLVGLAKDHDIPAIALLGETYGHPNYLGIKGAREILEILNKKLNLKLKLKELDEEIKQIEKEIKTKTKPLESLKKIKTMDGHGEGADYIG